VFDALNMHHIEVGLPVVQNNAKRVCQVALVTTLTAQVRARLRLYGICGGQHGIGTGLLRKIRCPLPIVQPTA
jgi:hypothetical protein